MAADSISRDDVERARGVIEGRLHRTPTLSCRSLGPNVIPEGRALPAHGLLQAPRDAEQGRVAHGRGEEARNRHVVGGKRSARRRVRRGPGRGRLPRLHVGDGESDEGGGHARLRSRRSISRRRVPADAHERLLEHVERTGADVRPPVRRRRSSRQATARSDSRSSRTCPPSHDRRPHRRRRPDRRRCGCRRLPCRRRRARELAPTLTDALAAGEPVRDRAALDRGRAQRPVHGSRARLLSVAERVDEVVLVSDDEIAEAMRFLYVRAKLACEPAGAAAVASAAHGQGSTSIRRSRSWQSCRAATRIRGSRLVSWRADEDRHPP